MNGRSLSNSKKQDPAIISRLLIAGTEKKLVFLSLVGRENSPRDPIHLHVQTQKEDDVWYLLDRSLPLRAVMADFCARLSLPYDALRFTYDGKRVPEAKSAGDLGIDDGDVIDAWFEMLGG